MAILNRNTNHAIAVHDYYLYPSWTRHESASWRPMTTPNLHIVTSSHQMHDSGALQPPQFTSKYIDGTPKRTLSTLIHDINREKNNKEDKYMCGLKRRKTSKNQTFIQGASNQVITNKHRVALPPKSHLSNSNTSQSLHHISPRRRKGAVHFDTWSLQRQNHVVETKTKALTGNFSYIEKLVLPSLASFAIYYAREQMA